MPRRMATNPYSIWPSDSYHEMIDRICQDEILAVISAGRAEPNEDDRAELRHIVAFNINAHVVPAGNA